MRGVSAAVVAILGSLLLASSSDVGAWGAQGHRLVAQVAANHLSAVARQNVAWLIGPATLPDVANWADDYRASVTQTAGWHFVNIPANAAAYDRDRDCPRQPGVAAGSRDDEWRDCVVDRLRYHEERLANARLDRADRAIALKFLVHFAGDLHQPWHASGIERGGNGIPVNVFGSDVCGEPPRPCNLHSVWDTLLIERRGLTDRAYVAQLERRVTEERLLQRRPGTAAEWAMESLTLSNAALLPPGGAVDQVYADRHLPVIEQRLALAGARLAQVLNRALMTRPPTGRAGLPGDRPVSRGGRSGAR